MKVFIFFMSLVLVLVTAKDLRCYRTASYGNCKGHRRMWAYSDYEDKCVPFDYSGCGGTDNRFFDKDQCESICSNPPKFVVT